MRTVQTVGWMMVALVGSQAVAQSKKPVNGLVGEYFNGPNFERKVMTRIDPAVDFDWNWQAPGPGVQREYFSVRWTGKLYAPMSGRYRFRATVDDGVRVWVNGRKVIDEWRKQDDSNFIGEIALQQGHLYDLRIEYYNDWKGSIISVFWELPNQNRLAYSNQVIPTRYLYTPLSRVRPTPARPQPTATRPPVVAQASRPVQPVPKQAPSKRAIQPATVTSTQPQPVRAAVVRVETTFDKLERGKSVILRHVQFQQGEYTLLPASSAELDKLVKALIDNPALTIEIAGHTDDVGDKRLNLALSENRATVVATYLIRHGIAENRITAKGYGGTRPIASNADEVQRAQNRRVELVVN